MKFLTLFFAIALTTSVFACGESDKTTSTSDDDTTTSTVSSTSSEG
jgi:ABC-type glycerol-3-phosphate transport system substrate-binding protein